MSQRKPASRVRIGLQAKSAMLLAFVVFAAAGASGWLHYTVTRLIFDHHDYQQADRLARGVALTAAADVLRRDRAALQRIANDLLDHSKVLHVAILDADGELLARARAIKGGVTTAGPSPKPASLSYELRNGPDMLELGRPILMPPEAHGPNGLAGAVRLIVDTHDTAALLSGVRQQIWIIAAAIVGALIPLGYFLVRRLILVPVRSLVTATRRLARGDFTGWRTATARTDEIGELANSFEAMAEKLHSSQRQLRGANESLEQKVAERTAELERANGRLRVEMAEKEEFLRAVSHDLNAPLRNIAGMAGLIAAKWRGLLPPEVLERLERIKANVDAEAELIAELLELSRIRTRPEKRETVDLGRLLDALAAALEYELVTKDISLTIAPPMPRLHVERNRIRQAFQNLIDNAIKYMGDGRDRRIHVDYERVDGMHRFRVADTGAGIDTDDQHRIFQVFQRVSTPAVASVPGRGLGLALVKTIASNYDGQVWVQSEPGAGSTFYFTLSAVCTEPPQDNGADGADRAARPPEATEAHAHPAAA